MSDLPDRTNAIIDAIIDHVGRSTLPFQRAHQEEHHATAFWFNELVETTSEGEVVRQYLVTASEPARVELAEFTLRPELCAPVMSAEKLMMLEFAEGWTHLGDLGVAVMSSTGLHAHGTRKGWHWTTDEVTDGIAATEQDIAGLGESPVPAYLLGHVNDGDGSREQAVVIGQITRSGDGGIRWIGDVPQGCVGAFHWCTPWRGQFQAGVRRSGTHHRRTPHRCRLRPHPRRIESPPVEQHVSSWNGSSGRRAETALVATAQLTSHGTAGPPTRSATLQADARGERQKVCERGSTSTIKAALTDCCRSQTAAAAAAAE
ncbi:hypothetical protein [Streptomyces sp. NPDC058954]|uniref:hypothetical protein n=1 Tax=Streptomyces sp. NPDC058954 TaxID=3346677 RepID=UPI00369F61DF